MVSGLLLEPYMRQGGQGVAEAPTVSKRLRNNYRSGNNVDIYNTYSRYRSI